MNPYAFQGAPMALPSGQRVFPTCAPFNPSQHWTTPVQDRVSLADVRWMVEASTGMVPLVVSLRQGQQSGDTLAFPLPGGPSAKVSPDSIDAVCAAVEALAPRPVVVHCLHGRNRTLLVLAALALRADKVATVDGALALVRRVRPPGIERANVVLALRRWWLAKKKGTRPPNGVHADHEEEGQRVHGLRVHDPRSSKKPRVRSHALGRAPGRDLPPHGRRVGGGHRVHVWLEVHARASPEAPPAAGGGQERLTSTFRRET